MIIAFYIKLYIYSSTYKVMKNFHSAKQHGPGWNVSRTAQYESEPSKHIADSSADLTATATGENLEISIIFITIILIKKKKQYKT